MTRFCYLGVWLNPLLDDNAHFGVLVADLFRKFNACYAKFAFCDRTVLLGLIVSYCTSFHGSVCCMLDTVQFRSLAVAWQKCMRVALKVPYRTHVSLLPPISGALFYFFARDFGDFFAPAGRTAKFFLPRKQNVSKLPKFFFAPEKISLPGAKK